MQTRNNKGFTLLEILLVIAAIGILAAIVIVAINPLRQISKSENASRWSNINTIQKALDQYYIANGKYPDEVVTNATGEYKEICIGGQPVGCIDLEADLVPAYIAEIPRDPNGGGYKVGINPLNNQISVWADKAKLGDLIVINGIIGTANLSLEVFDGLILVTGSPSIGNTINVNIDSWTGIGTTNPVTYQWYRDGVEIAGETNSSYTLQSLDSGESITVEVLQGDLVLGTSIGNIFLASIICPSGYIKVDGNSLYNTEDFCVMKYEAKSGGVSQPAGLPLVNVSQSSSQCPSGQLINNNEWMTIARDVEQVNENWTGGSVGVGALFTGHSDSDPNNTLEAGLDTDPYYGTNNSYTGNDFTSRQKRVLQLSNGNLIWDFAGNVAEWTDDIILGQNKPYRNGEQFTPAFIEREWTFWDVVGSGYGSLSYDLVRPSNNTWNSLQGTGLYMKGPIDNNAEYAFLRGGSYSSPFGVGIYTLNLWYDRFSFSSSWGYRCVIRQ